jgi:hypothetical protein
MKSKAIFVLCFLIKFSFAQDTIIKKNNDMVQAKIVEISPTQVKYKKFNFQDGPTYIESKGDIASIRFANGTRETFDSPAIEKPSSPVSPATQSASIDYYDPNAGRVPTTIRMERVGSKYRYSGRKIGEREMHEVLLKTRDKDIIQKIQSAKDAKRLQYIGFAAIPLGIASLVTLASSQGYNTTNQGAVTGGLVLLGAAIACPILSGVFKHKRTLSNIKAVELYNQRY